MSGSIKYYSFSLLAICAFIISCDKSEIHYEPNAQDLIIGNWQLKKVWRCDMNGYVTTSEIIFVNFNTDSLASFQKIVNGNLVTETYRYKIDTLLHFDNTNTPWFYEFTNQNTLKLDNAFPALIPVGLVYVRVD